MIYSLNFFILSLLTILTSSLLPEVKILGVVPLLPLFFIVSLSLYRKGIEPIFLAALVGLYFDIFSGLPFGFYLGLCLSATAIVRYFFEEGLKDIGLGRYMLINLALLTVFWLGSLLEIIISKNYFSGFTTGIISFSKMLSVNALFAFIFYYSSVWYFDKIDVLSNYLKRR